MASIDEFPLLTVEVDAWAFFDADGNALQAQFVEPNSGTLWRKPGSYILKASRAPGARSLQDYLPQAAAFENSGNAPFADLAEVQAHLQRRTSSGSANE